MKMVRLGLLFFLFYAGCQNAQRDDSVDKSKQVWTSEGVLSVPAEYPQNISWGEEVDGLQLGAWLDRDDSVLFCVIRNRSDQSILYSDYLLGSWESISIQVQSIEPDAWSALERKGGLSRYVKSAGASMRYVHFLSPGKNMPPPYKTGSLVSGVLDPIYTFTVDLKDYEWGGELPENVSLVVTQSLGQDGSDGTWTGTLRSGPIYVDQ